MIILSRGGFLVSYSFEFYDDLSTIMVTIRRDIDMRTKMPPLSQEVYRLLNQVDHPVFYFTDISDFTLSCSDLLRAGTALVRGPYPFATHPNFKALIMVTDGEGILPSAEGMRSEVFGGIEVEIFGSTEAAIDYIRSHQ